jgi:hypothetical protein
MKSVPMKAAEKRATPKRKGRVIQNLEISSALNFFSSSCGGAIRYFPKLLVHLHSVVFDIASIAPQSEHIAYPVSSHLRLACRFCDGPDGVLRSEQI